MRSFPDPQFDAHHCPEEIVPLQFSFFLMTASPPAVLTEWTRQPTTFRSKAFPPIALLDVKTLCAKNTPSIDSEQRSHARGTKVPLSAGHFYFLPFMVARFVARWPAQLRVAGSVTGGGRQHSWGHKQCAILREAH